MANQYPHEVMNDIIIYLTILPVQYFLEIVFDLFISIESTHNTWNSDLFFRFLFSEFHFQSCAYSRLLRLGESGQLGRGNRPVVNGESAGAWPTKRSLEKLSKSPSS